MPTEYEYVITLENGKEIIPDEPEYQVFLTTLAYAQESTGSWAQFPVPSQKWPFVEVIKDAGGNYTAKYLIHVDSISDIEYRPKRAF